MRNTNYILDPGWRKQKGLEGLELGRANPGRLLGSVGLGESCRGM